MDQDSSEPHIWSLKFFTPKIGFFRSSFKDWDFSSQFLSFSSSSLSKKGPCVHTSHVKFKKKLTWLKCKDIPKTKKIINLKFSFQEYKRMKYMQEIGRSPSDMFNKSLGTSSGSLSSSISISDQSYSTDCVEEYISDMPFAGKQYNSNWLHYYDYYGTQPKSYFYFFPPI